MAKERGGTPDSEELGAESALAKIDTALANVDRAISLNSRPTALAALSQASSALNSLHASLAIDEVPNDMLSFQTPPLTGNYVVHSFIGNPFRKGKDELLENLESKLASYYRAVDKIVEKFKPAQFQISLGFPLIVSVTFTWNT
jgi:hypothetical protein